MLEPSQNPWTFSNNDRALSSPDMTKRIEYGELKEIAIGSPLVGQCFLIDAGIKYELANFCAGPPIWETEGKLVAIPIWARKLFTGTVQQIIIVDTIKRTRTLYRNTFRVLDLHSFTKNIVYGYDSPIYKTKEIAFDINKSKISKVENL
jgi:hypothetical protein